MPMVWTEPETLLEHREVIIYHTYKDQAVKARRTYWFTTSYYEDGEFEFDVRDLPTYEGTITTAIVAAINRGLLKLPEDVFRALRPVICIRLDIERYVYAGNDDMIYAAYSDMANELKTVLPRDEFTARCSIEETAPEDYVHISDFLMEQHEPPEE